MNQLIVLVLNRDVFVFQEVKIDDLDKTELNTLQEWIEKFEDRYVVCGKLPNWQEIDPKAKPSNRKNPIAKKDI
jgi:hypothetical protein